MNECRCIAVDDFEHGIGFMDTRGCPIHGDDQTKSEPQPDEEPGDEADGD